MIKGEIYTDKINAAMTKAINNGLKAACIMVEGQAVNLVPVDDGRLKGSITWKTNSERGGGGLKTPVDKNQGIVGTNVEYAPYVEYGTGIYAEEGNGRTTPWVYKYEGKKGPKGWRWTVGQKPQSYLRKALDIRRKDIVKYFKTAFDRALK